MPDNDVEKFLAEQKAVEDRRKQLIEALLREKADAIKSFDEKLEKLGYEPDGAKARRSHHKRATAPAPAAKPKDR